MRSSLVLGPALSALPKTRGARILDLGQASGANVAFFRPYCRCITIADLDLLGGDGAKVSASLPPGSEGPFDLILTWDRCNYLDPSQLESLFSELGQWCRNGTRLVAFVYYSQEMSARPGQFHVRDTEHLTWISGSTVKSRAPRYKESILLRALAGFEVERVFLLRHGVEEYLFCYRG